MFCFPIWILSCSETVKVIPPETVTCVVGLENDDDDDDDANDGTSMLVLVSDLPPPIMGIPQTPQRPSTTAGWLHSSMYPMVALAEDFFVMLMTRTKPVVGAMMGIDWGCFFALVSLVVVLVVVVVAAAVVVVITELPTPSDVLSVFLSFAVGTAFGNSVILFKSPPPFCGPEEIDAGAAGATAGRFRLVGRL